MKLLIINNIKSGLGDGSIYDFIRSFSKENDEIVLRNVYHNTDINTKLTDAKDFDIIVVSGGDDTVSKVSYSLKYTDIPILPYPSGTTNLIAQNLFIPSEPHAIAKLARAKQTMKFDIGEISTDTATFGFGCNAGIGYSTKISKEAMTTRKSLGVFSYIGAALSNYKPQDSKFEIELDDKKIQSEGVGVLLLNFAKIGLDLKLTHLNRPLDGLFDVVILKGKTAFKYIPALTAAALDNAIDFPDRSDALESHLASKVKITATPTMELQVDGKPTELKTPFSVRVLKHAANYVIDPDNIEATEN